MMINLIRIFFLGLIFLFVGCTDAQKNNRIQETLKRGKINVTIDEAFKPVFQELIKVFSASYSEVVLNVSYKSEAQCIKDWYNDSVRLIFCTKKLEQKENDMLYKHLEFHPAQSVVAYDGLALIVNKKNTDTLLDISEVKNILTQENNKYFPIVDGLDESSALRYIKTNILKGKPYSKKLQGSKNSVELIDNIANNKNALGFIGVSWIGDKEDSLQITFNKKIKIVALPCNNCEEKDIYVKPYQVNLLNNKYPFLREISYVLKENYEGPGRGFVNFVSNERGQLIFKRSYLIPAKINFNVRRVKL